MILKLRHWKVEKIISHFPAMPLESCHKILPFSCWIFQIIALKNEEKKLKVFNFYSDATDKTIIKKSLKQK